MKKKMKEEIQDGDGKDYEWVLSQPLLFPTKLEHQGSQNGLPPQLVGVDYPKCGGARAISNNLCPDGFQE